MSGARRTFVFLYAASGAAALVYEVELDAPAHARISAIPSPRRARCSRRSWAAWRSARGRHGRCVARDAETRYAALEAADAESSRCCCPSRFARRPRVSRGRMPTAPRPSRFALVRVVDQPDRCSAFPPPPWARPFRSPSGGWPARPPTPAPCTPRTPPGRRSARSPPASGSFPRLGLRGTTWVGVALNVVAATGVAVACRGQTWKFLPSARCRERSEKIAKKAKKASAASACSAVRIRTSTSRSRVHRRGALGLRRARLRSRVDAPARARHRPDNLRVRDDGGGVHQRDCRSDRRSPPASRRGRGNAAGWLAAMLMRARSPPRRPRGSPRRGCR